MLSGSPASQPTTHINATPALSTAEKQKLANVISDVVKPLFGTMLLTIDYTSKFLTTFNAGYMIKLQQLETADHAALNKGLSITQQLKIDVAALGMLDQVDTATQIRLYRGSNAKQTTDDLINLFTLNKSCLDALLDDLFKAVTTANTSKDLTKLMTEFKLTYFDGIVTSLQEDANTDVTTEEKSASADDTKIMEVFNNMFTGGLKVRVDVIRMEALNMGRPVKDKPLSQEQMQEMAEQRYKEIIQGLSVEQRKALATAANQNDEAKFLSQFMEFGGKDKALKLAKDFFQKVVASAPASIITVNANKIADYLVRQNGKSMAQVQQDTQATLEMLRNFRF